MAAASTCRSFELITASSASHLDRRYGYLGSGPAPIALRWTIFRTPTFSAASTTFRVPCTLMLWKVAGPFSRMTATVCTTISTPSHAAFRESGSVTSPVTKCTAGSPEGWLFGPGLTSRLTSSPRSTSRATIRFPMNPVAPVTSIKGLTFSGKSLPRLAKGFWRYQLSGRGNGRRSCVSTPHHSRRSRSGRRSPRRGWAASR